MLYNRSVESGNGRGSLFVPVVVGHPPDNLFHFEPDFPVLTPAFKGKRREPVFPSAQNSRTKRILAKTLYTKRKAFGSRFIFVNLAT